MRLRFTIRDLLWLTVVVAALLGWWVDRKQLASDRAAWKARAGNLEENVQRDRASYQSQPSTPEPTVSASPREREKEAYRRETDRIAPETERGFFPK